MTAPTDTHVTAPNSTHELDAMVYAAEGAGNHLELAERLNALAAAIPRGPGSLRAEMLVAAAEQFALAGENAWSVDCAREAVADGGAVRCGASSHLVAALYTAEEHQQAHGALADLRRTRPTDLGLHLFVGELCERHGDLADALWWYTRGLVLAEREGASGDQLLDIGSLLLGRWRVRQATGLPADDWDAIAAGVAERIEDELLRLPAQRQPSRRSCACGSGRKAKRCCGTTADHGEGVLTLISADPDVTYIDLVSG